MENSVIHSQLCIVRCILISRINPQFLLSILEEILSTRTCLSKDNLTLSTNKNCTIFNRPSDWLMAESWEVSWEIYDMEGLEVRIDLQTKSSQMFSWQHWATEHWMSESVQSLVSDINYQNVNLHNDDTVEHLDNVDKDIPYIFSALPLRALLYSKMMTILKI